VSHFLHKGNLVAQNQTNTGMILQYTWIETAMSEPMKAQNKAFCVKGGTHPEE
jgi:hypothetical protein